MKDLIDFLRNNWIALSAAPGAFFLLVVLAFGAAFVIARWRYDAIVENLKERLAGLKERLEGKDSQLDDYRERLHLIPASGSAFSRLSNAEIKARTLDFVAKIRVFLAERKSTDYSILFDKAGINRDASDIDHQRAWEIQTNALMRKSIETVNVFDTHYKVDAILLRDELHSRLPAGSKNEREFLTYEHPTNPIGMGIVADDLERLAKSLSVSTKPERA